MSGALASREIQEVTSANSQDSLFHIIRDRYSSAPCRHRLVQLMGLGVCLSLRLFLRSSSVEAEELSGGEKQG